MSNSSKDLSSASALNGRTPALDEQEFPCNSKLIVLCVRINPTLRRRFRAAHKHVVWAGRPAVMDRFFKKKYVNGSEERKLQNMLTAHFTGILLQKFNSLTTFSAAREDDRMLLQAFYLGSINIYMAPQNNNSILVSFLAL